MVMEVTPSPQCVGREFVRQYYTLLNEAPDHLHRFYNEKSLFIHGGLDVPNRETKQVVGQKQIHEHIQQLNFRDCHAKISQVDSQATLGDGVVVQVSGELSNGGQPMRRFTQTFVLAAQAPKKYYVHNDIFRYQDMLITDEEPDQGDVSRSDGEDDQECESCEINQNGQGDYYVNSSASPDVISGSHQVIEDHTAFPPPPNVTQPVMDVMQSTTQPTTYASPPSTQQFPTVKQVEESIKPVETPPSPQQQQPEENWGDSWNDGSETVEPTPIETSQQIAYEPEPPVISNEPKTYANLLKSSGGGGGGYQQKPPQQQPAQVQPPQFVQPSSMSPPPMGRSSDINNSSRDNSNRNSLSHQQNMRGPRPGPGARVGANNRGMSRDRPLQQSQPRASFSEDDSEKSMGYKNTGPRHSNNYSNRDSGGMMSSNGGLASSFNDNQQLFLGNIPHYIQEDELRELFSRFGTVVELRIHSKPNHQKPGGRTNVPNYGFVMYEDANTVQNVLQSRPIYYPDNDPNNSQAVKLNVEEKKRKNPSQLSNNDSSDRPPRRDDNRPRGGPPMRGGRGGPRVGGSGGMYNRDRSDGQRGSIGGGGGGLRNSTSNNSYNKNR